ncbi:MAG: ATP-binding protein [Candidatus Schekmanbacteria bacterium]|nr:ATP-binding protein [Candidatus Schekmanbacteria bacterium]
MLDRTADFYHFQRLPETTGIHQTAQMAAARRDLARLLQERVGLVAVFGLTGVGKTYLVNELLEQSRRGSPYLISLSKVPEKGSYHFNIALSELARDFELVDRKKVASRSAEIEGFLRQCASGKRHPVFIIDQAQAHWRQSSGECARSG